jgi:spore maturation protein CgeB
MKTPGMKIVIFGLSISSAWGNGHAALLRGLFRSLHQQGHQIHFFERDVPYYASHRDVENVPYAHLHLYSGWNENLSQAKRQLADADVAVVTSYCPDGRAACELILQSNVPRTVFYDMDTPVTLSRLERGEPVDYIPQEGLGGFDLVLSYTGGDALHQLESKLGARVVAPLYGWVDPASYRRVAMSSPFESDLSYLGTYSADRQPSLEQLLLAPASQLCSRRFLIAGAMYPDPSSWPVNVRHFEHIAPPEHATFYSSSPLTLNVTRASMASMGFCPSGRLFEAAACGTAVLSDWWLGLDTFFAPGEEILIATSSADTIAALQISSTDRRRIAARAQQRTLDCHTAAIRAQRLISLLESPRNEDSSAQTVLAGARAC